MGQYEIFSPKAQQARVGFLDETRGLCIILMVVYHGIFSMIYFGADIALPSGAPLFYSLFYSRLFRFGQPFVAGIFIFISGIACRYSRSNLKRGALALALGLVITVFTVYIMPLFLSDALGIYFGILHFLGTGMILFALLRPLLDQTPPLIGLLVCLALFALTYGAKQGFVGIPGLWVFYAPPAWFYNRWLLPIGFAVGGADHFPLLPWLFLFLSGSFLGVAFIERDMPRFFYRNRSRFLAAAGKRTIYIYLLHQPAIFGILYASSIIGALFA